MSVIQEETGAHTNSVDQQVQVAVAIHVRERGAGGKLSGTCHAGTGSNVGEPPSAKIPVEGVVAFQTAEIDITQSVAIHVTERDPGAVEADLVFGSLGIAQHIGEVNAGQLRRQQRKPHASLRIDR